jgi:hypothetical protein
MHPGGDGPREPRNVGGERRIVLQMIRRVIADDIDDGRGRAARIVQIGETVREPGTQMEKRAGGLLRHAAVPVGRTRGHTFEQRQHGPHAFDLVERRHEMHFRRARIGETHLHAASDQSANQTFSAVHGDLDGKRVL